MRCKRPGKSPEAQPSDTQQNTVRDTISTVSGPGTARQPTNFRRPLMFGPSQVRLAPGQGRPHDSILRGTDLALEALSDARLLSTLSPSKCQANSSQGQPNRGFLKPNTGREQSNRRSLSRGPIRNFHCPAIFPLHKPFHP